MIYRTVKDKDNRYVRLNVAAANDERLSYKAVGIHTYIMTKPDGWEANETDIARRHADGLASVRSGVKELIQHGYMVRVRTVDAQKRVTGWRIDTFETPELNPHFIPGDPSPAHVDEPDCENLNLATEPDCEKPHVENPHVENPHVENRNHSNKRIVVKIDTSNNGVEGIVADATPAPEWPQFLEALCWTCYGHKKLGMLTATDKGKLTAEAKRIRAAGFGVDDLRAWFRDEWQQDWRWKKDKSRPDPAHVRGSIASVSAETPEGFEEKPGVGYAHMPARSKVEASLAAVDYVFDQIDEQEALRDK